MNAVNSIMSNAYDQQIKDQLKAGSIFKTSDSTMPCRQGDNMMNITAKTARVKAGFLAQILNGSTIVWESKKAYKNAEKAIKVANSKIDNSIDKLFNK
jgi:hypothetical protein